jgi:hypothetical protein
MLTRTRTNAVTTATPGTLPVPSPLMVTSRSARIAWTKVATKRPIASWPWLVPQDALHDARRKLTHGELDDDHRDREHERGQTHHRGGDGRKDVSRSIRTANEASGKRLVVEVAVDSDRPEGESRPGKYAEHWHEPEARFEVDEQLGASHATVVEEAYPLDTQPNLITQSHIAVRRAVESDDVAPAPTRALSFPRYAACGVWKATKYAQSSERTGRVLIARRDVSSGHASVGFRGSLGSCPRGRLL